MSLEHFYRCYMCFYTYCYPRYLKDFLSGMTWHSKNIRRGNWGGGLENSNIPECRAPSVRMSLGAPTSPPQMGLCRITKRVIGPDPLKPLECA